MNEAQIRTVFGLKLRQLREEKQLSLFGLSKMTGLSKSYLNEIEKGKKYPKTDKVLLLAKALEIDYDKLVSLKLTGKMAPVADMVASGILEEIPLSLFGIEEQQLIDIMINAPEKVNAFMSTIFQIARDYNVTKENFYLAALRSYQEAHQNYFADLEEAAIKAAKHFHLYNEGRVRLETLEELVQDELGYELDYDTLKGKNRQPKVRSVFVDGNPKRLLIDPEISESQKIFLLAKELGYEMMKLNIRPTTFTWIHFNSFEEVLNNFKASYFAGALLLPEQTLDKELKKLFALKQWNPTAFGDLMERYTDSMETFFQRLTNILPSGFGMERLFFLRFENQFNNDDFSLSKELHISRQHQPHGNQTNDHYCRRWIALDILKKPENYKSGKLEIGIQRSTFVNTDKEYVVISARQKDPFKPDYYRSISIGAEVNEKLKKQVAFLNDEAITRKQVSVTCENCPIMDCTERVKPPIRLKRKEENEKIRAHVEQVMKGTK